MNDDKFWELSEYLNQKLQKDIEVAFGVDAELSTASSSYSEEKPFEPKDFESLLERLRPKPEVNLLSVIVSDKWGSDDGVLKVQLESGFHFIIAKPMLEKIKKSSILQNAPSTFSHCFGVPIVEDDDLAERVLVEAYLRTNPHPFWLKTDGYFFGF